MNRLSIVSLPKAFSQVAAFYPKTEWSTFALQALDRPSRRPEWKTEISGIVRPNIVSGMDLLGPIEELCELLYS